MRNLLFAVPIASFALLFGGCSDAPQEADTSHLNSPEADEAGQREAAKYENAGRKGPADSESETKTK